MFERKYYRKKVKSLELRSLAAVEIRKIPAERKEEKSKSLKFNIKIFADVFQELHRTLVRAKIVC